MSKASVEALNELHGLLAQSMTHRLLAAKVAGGEPLSAAEWSAMAKFLKDNHIEQLNVPGSPLANLVASLPFPTVGIEH